MNLRTALKIIKMTKMSLTEQFGGVAKGLAKRIEAGRIVKKSGVLRKPKPKVKKIKSAQTLKRERVAKARRGQV